jgi:hypothetical protein
MATTETHAAASSNGGLRIAVALGVAAWLGGIAAWGVVYSGSPETIPIHFDAAGRPDGYACRAAGAITMIVIATVVQATLLGAAFLTRYLAERHPSQMNLPARRQLIALPAAMRVHAVLPVGVGLALASVPTQAIFAYAALGSYRIGSGDWTTLPSAPLFVALAAILALVFGGIVVATRRVRRLTAGSPR